MFCGQHLNAFELNVFLVGGKVDLTDNTKLAKV